VSGAKNRFFWRIKRIEGGRHLVELQHAVCCTGNSILAEGAAEAAETGGAVIKTVCLFTKKYFRFGMQIRE
jgi:hypothetical protein